MPTQVLIYKDPVPLNAQNHAELCIKPGTSFQFAASINSVPLTAAEFAQASASYPIVFTGEGDNIVPAAILGFGKEENVFVDAEGGWTGGYVPAFLRRYPFVFSDETKDGQLILFVDQSFEGCNTEGRGERLFDVEGNHTGYLKTVLGFLQEYQASFARTQAFCSRLSRLGLLRPAEANWRNPDGEGQRLGGFLTVDREALKNIDDGELREMFANDELECVYLHLASLRHIESIAQRAADRGSEAPEEPTVAQALGKIMDVAEQGDVAIEPGEDEG
ncbi:SapC family protein [Tropicibacter sp. R16_0]|nr:SapC family protein [Tropicibacter sp. R16_0]